MTSPQQLGVGAGLLLGLAAVGFLAARRVTRAPAPRKPRTKPQSGPNVDSKIVGQRLNRSAAILAVSVLCDSAVEHYRGSFQNRAMYTPLAASSLTLAASVFGVADQKASAHWARDATYAFAAASGFAGLGFHAFNIGKRPGGYTWLNFFYAAPIGAPMALALAGLLGRGAERVRETPASQRPTIFDIPAGDVLAAVSAIGLLGTVGEAALLHFRGAYHDPFMFIPVSVPPAAALALARAFIARSERSFSMARAWLQATAAVGLIGVGFHSYGVSRNMGGWRNWSQNILNGPPLPAPPSFTGLALAGLAALTLLEDATHG